MKILLNGNEHLAEDGLSITGLLISLQLADKRVAVEINQAIVPRSRHDTTVLQPLDKVEIIHAIGGG